MRRLIQYAPTGTSTSWNSVPFTAAGPNFIIDIRLTMAANATATINSYVLASAANELTETATHDVNDWTGLPWWMSAQQVVNSSIVFTASATHSLIVSPAANIHLVRLYYDRQPTSTRMKLGFMLGTANTSEVSIWINE